MTIKTGILAAAAALTLAVPAAALAQPFYGSPSYGYSHRESFRRDDWRRVEREREFRRAEELRRLRWEREHSYRSGYRSGAGYGYGNPYYR